MLALKITLNIKSNITLTVTFKTLETKFKPVK